MKNSGPTEFAIHSIQIRKSDKVFLCVFHKLPRCRLEGERKNKERAHRTSIIPPFETHAYQLKNLQINNLRDGNGFVFGWSEYFFCFVLFCFALFGLFV